MATSNYLLINQAFAEAHAGYNRDGLYFNYGITLLGYYVCAENTLTEFPELFENDSYLTGLPIIELDTADFPPPVNLSQ